MQPASLRRRSARRMSISGATRAARPITPISVPAAPAARRGASTAPAPASPAPRPPRPQLRLPLQQAVPTHLDPAHIPRHLPRAPAASSPPLQVAGVEAEVAEAAARAAAVLDSAALLPHPTFPLRAQAQPLRPVRCPPRRSLPRPQRQPVRRLVHRRHQRTFLRRAPPHRRRQAIRRALQAAPLPRRTAPTSRAAFARRSAPTSMALRTGRHSFRLSM